MIYVITIAIYLIGLVIIGFFKAKQIKTQSDFSVAGRALTRPCDHGHFSKELHQICQFAYTTNNTSAILIHVDRFRGPASTKQA